MYILDSPFAPKNFSQVDSPNPTSIRVRWIAIPSNETGEHFTGYKLFYFYKGTIESTNKTEKRLASTPINVDPNYAKEDIEGVTYLYYTIPNLNPRATYYIWVLGYNMYGDGDPTSQGIKGERDTDGAKPFVPGVNRKYY